MRTEFDEWAKGIINYKSIGWQDRIHCGDCLDVMKSFPKNSVDLVMTSPPYADARKHTYSGISPDS